MARRNCGLIEADAPAGFEAGPTANNERLYLPDIHPAGSIGIWEVVEVAGVEVAEIFISHGGIQGATGADRRLVLPVSVTADALIRTGFWPRSSTTASYIQLTGNADTLPASTVVKIYLAVVRGDSGGGGGGGGGLDQAAVDARVAAGVLDTAETGSAAAWGVAKGGTGATTAAAARTALSVLTQAAVDARVRAALVTALTGTQTGITVTLQTDGSIDFVVPAAPSDHSRRIARSTDTTLTEGEVTAGHSSTTGDVDLPPWGQGVEEYVFIGVPEDEDDITDFLINGVGAFNGFQAYVDASNDPIIVSAHKWWRTVSPQDGEYGYEGEIVQ